MKWNISDIDKEPKDKEEIDLDNPIEGEEDDDNGFWNKGRYYVECEQCGGLSCHFCNNGYVEKTPK